VTFDVTYVIGGAVSAPDGAQEFCGVRLRVDVTAADRPAAYAAVYQELAAAGFDVVVAPHGPLGVPLGFTLAELEAVLALGVPFEGDRLSRPATAGVQIERIEAREETAAAPEGVTAAREQPAAAREEALPIDVWRESAEPPEELQEPDELEESEASDRTAGGSAAAHEERTAAASGAAALPPDEGWTAEERALLGLVAEGETSFWLPDDADEATCADFDATVDRLLSLQRRGLLVVPTPTANLRNPMSQYRSVIGVHLTEAGREVVAAEGRLILPSAMPPSDPQASPGAPG
jgi:hypothetical protein